MRIEVINQLYIDIKWPEYEADAIEDARELIQMDAFWANVTLGQICVWVSGRDCDGMRYAHVSRLRDCYSYEDYCRRYNEALDWADGPLSWSIIPNDDVIEAWNEQYHIDTFAIAAGY